MILSDINREDYDGDGVSREWPITFPINGITTDDIDVYKVDSGGEATLLTGSYEVDLTNSKVVYPTVASGLAVLTSSEAIIILRVLDLTQLIDYKNQGPLPAETIEDGLDRLTMMMGQLNEEIGRCIQFSITEALTPEEYIQALKDAVTDAETAQTASEAARDLSEDYRDQAEVFKNEAESAAAGMASFVGTFENSDLSSGVLTITHNFALDAPYVIDVIIFDNSGKEVVPDDITGATNSVAVDLSSYGTLVGTWGYMYGARASVNYATQAQAEAGTNNEAVMTPLRTAQAIDSQVDTDLVNDTTPQLGGDLDLNGNDINFPSVNLTDILDEDDMASDSNTKGATQQSIKAYADAITIQSKIVNVAVTSTGSLSVTGVGFQPKAIIFTNRGYDSSVDTASGSGFCDEDRNCRSSYFERKSDGATNSGNSGSSIELGSGGSYQAFFEFTVTSFDSDGFTINRTVGNTGGICYALCIR